MLVDERCGMPLMGGCLLCDVKTLKCSCWFKLSSCLWSLGVETIRKVCWQPLNDLNWRNLGGNLSALLMKEEIQVF